MTGDHDQALNSWLGLRPQPMVHVGNLLESRAFFELLGGESLYTSRDGDWALIDFAGTRLSLLAHPPADAAQGAIELHFTAEAPLLALESRVLRANPGFVAQSATDEAFGRMLQLKTPDGLIIKVIEVERDLVA